MMSWENPWGASRDLIYRIRTLPNYLIWSLLGFISGWVQTRRVATLFIGLPSLVIASLVVATTLRARAGLTTETVRRYIETAQQLLKENQIEQAEFYMSRLKSLDYQSDALLVTRAEIDTRRNRPDLSEDCYRQMLGNPDNSLDSLAHQQLALSELKASSSPDSPQATSAIHHLEQALLVNADDVVSHELLAQLFQARQDFESAIKHWEPVALQKPAVHLELARLYNKLDRQVMKAESATKAEKYYAEEIAKPAPPSGKLNEADSENIRRSNLFLNLIESLVLQDKLDDAAKLATDALDRSHSPELRRRLASIYLMKANSLPATDASWSKRWELVALSRNYNPDAPESIAILANIAANGPSKLRQMAVQEITPYLDRGQAPPSAYFQVGTAAAEEKQWDTATRLLRKSVEVDPQADAGWNNLAHTLLSQPQPDPIEAERCVNEALRLNSAPPRYHQTRGQIMIRLKKWSEAARELEIARHKLPPEPEIHLGLAEIYRELGDEDLATYHRGRYEALTR